MTALPDSISMDFPFDSAIIGAIVAIATVVLGGLVWWCQRVYSRHVVKQHRRQLRRLQSTRSLQTIPSPLKVVRHQSSVRAIVNLQDPSTKNLREEYNGAIPCDTKA